MNRPSKSYTRCCRLRLHITLAAIVAGGVLTSLSNNATWVGDRNVVIIKRHRDGSREVLTLQNVLNVTYNATVGDGGREATNSNVRIRQHPLQPDGIDNVDPILHLVHVGKAGGLTLHHVLRVACLTKEKAATRVRCLQQLPDSALSRHTYYYQHGSYVKSMVAGHDRTHVTYWFLLRHPLDRIESWYHYVHPANCVSGGASVNCEARRVLERSSSSVVQLFFQKCFPTWTHVGIVAAELINASNREHNVSNVCFRLLQQALQHGRLRLEGRVGMHLRCNLRYYVDHTLGTRQDGVVVARTENFWPDLQRLDIQLGGNGTFGRWQDTASSHGSALYMTKRTNATMASSSASHHQRSSALCCLLRNELQLYHDLLLRARNLPANETNTTWQRALAHCSFASERDMRVVCQGLRVE